MFTFLSRFRRQTAVLTALALVASVLVAVPASAADDDPKADYTATFSACVGAATEDQEFTDVPELHANWGDINCIGYYGITMGTGDGTTYSPIMSVTRKQMALFLTRLAEVVGIPMVADPADPGFTDIGDLDEDAQTAIAQLKELNITKGNNPSGTTYGPEGHVTRGQMALFIARLMEHMEPMAMDSDTVFGYKPEDVGVVDVIDTTDDDVDDPDEPGKARSPFTDLDRVTKETYDAITNLWELGVVAKGISDTGYAPSASIRRDHMAAFMAGVLDHSNARPAGVTMQTTKNTDFGSVAATRAISVRDDDFAPMADVSVKVFTATDSGGFDDDTGKCLTDNECDWSDNEEITGDDGNIFDPISVDTDDGDGADGNMENSETWYAWMGSDDSDEFVKGESGEASVTLTAKADALGIRVTADINKEAANNATEPNQVDVSKDRTVVITAQLIDTTTAGDASEAVAKEGVELTIGRTRQTVPDVPGPGSMKTDADGKVTFTIMGPEDDDDTPVSRDDTVTFTGNTDDDNTTGTDGNESDTITIRWRNTPAAVAEGVTDAPTYVIIDDDEVSVKVMVAYYDQYGNPAASGDRLTITVNNTEDNSADGTDTSGENAARVRSSGIARFTANLNAAAGHAIDVEVSALQAATDITAPDVPNVLAVRHAHKNDDGVSGNQLATASQVIVDADNDRFIIDTGDGTSGTIAGVLYSYKADDTFIVDDKTSDLSAFEEAIEENGNTVEVVLYDPDGKSIFSVGKTP